MAKLDFRLVPDLTPDLALKLVSEHLARRGFHDVEVIDAEDGLLHALALFPFEADELGAHQAPLARVGGLTDHYF